MESLIARFIEDAPVKGLAIMEDTVNRLLRRKVSYLLMLILLTPVSLTWFLNDEINNNEYTNEAGERVILDGIDEKSVSEHAAGWFFTIFTYLYLKILILIVVLSLGMGLILDEKEDKTLQLLVTSPLTRFEVLFYKYIAGVPIMTLLIWVPVLIFYFISMAIVGMEAVTENLGLVGLSLLLIFLACAAYTALFFAFTTFFKRPMLTGVVFIFIYEFFIGIINWPFQRITVIHYINSAAYPTLSNKIGSTDAREILNLFDHNGEAMITHWVVSLFVLSIISIVFFALAASSLKNKDIT